LSFVFCLFLSVLCSGKYQVTDKVSGLFAGLSKKAGELDGKYNLTSKAGTAAGAALDGVAGAANATTAAATTPGAAPAPAPAAAAAGTQSGGAAGPTAI
jgi:hypothetical protein